MGDQSLLTLISRTGKGSMQPNEHSTNYQIRIQGQLDQRWLRFFEGLDISALQGGETILGGAMDQAALHGILNRIRDLGMELISVQRYQPQDETSKVE
jgi:hypothetical protein